MPRFARALLLLSVLPTLAAAQHFSIAYVDIRLIRGDSILVEVSADRQDMMNTVGIFPHMGGIEGNGYQLYQQNIEAYLQTRLTVLVDRKRQWLAAVRWKPGGKDRNDWLDSVSIWEPYHVITLGGKLSGNPKSLSIRADLWIEREDKPRYTTVEYALFHGNTPLRRTWIGTERWLNISLHPDSIARMRATPPSPATPREAVDHTGHGH